MEYFSTFGLLLFPYSQWLQNKIETPNEKKNNNNKEETLIRNVDNNLQKWEVDRPLTQNGVSYAIVST